MNKADRKELGRYLRGSADDLGLRDWTFTLAKTFADDPYAAAYVPKGCDAIGSNCTDPGQKHARIFIGEDASEWPQDKLKKTVAHELLHCHLAPMWHQVFEDLEDHLSTQAYDLFTDSWQRNAEYCIDGISEAWSTSMPNIRWPSDRNRS